ncbi:hypothetical protein ES708_06144 [subsurface metagenome]
MDPIRNLINCRGFLGLIVKVAQLLPGRSPEFQPWEFGLASMIMTDLETIGIFNIIGKERLNDVMKEQEFQLSGMVRESDIAKMGELVGAKYILAGAFMEMDGSMRIEAQVYSVEKGTQIGTASVTGKTVIC